MPRVTLSDGRTVDLRPMYISDELAIVDIADREFDGPRPRIDLLRAYAAVVEAAVTGRSWSGSFLEMSERDLTYLFGEWRRLSDEDAVPPAVGTPSPTPSPEHGSAAPMAGE